MNYYIQAFKKYAVFSGRSTRPEFWYFVLFNLIIGVVLSMITQFLSGLFGLITLVPSIAVGIRRMHDTGKSGWWLLISLIPIIGPIIYLVLAAMPSKVGNNKYVGGEVVNNTPEPTV